MTLDQFQQTYFTKHERGCIKWKKRLSGALAKAKEYTNRKSCAGTLKRLKPDLRATPYLNLDSLRTLARPGICLLTHMIIVILHLTPNNHIAVTTSAQSLITPSFPGHASQWPPTTAST
ncbi:hypothetical protein BDN67DRAFT_984039 [Paxillus ammoniavirescens]|nr:hypothetical protein BDN67DRAFT_984039 [Paxillus ammoniavirescens]